MHETPADLRRIQHLLDTSQAAGGRHLREVFTDDLRLTAAELCDRLARFEAGWIDWAASTAGYFRIEPRRMFASRLPGA